MATTMSYDAGSAGGFRQPAFTPPNGAGVHATAVAGPGSAGKGRYETTTLTATILIDAGLLGLGCDLIDESELPFDALEALMRFPSPIEGVYISRIVPDGLLARNGTLHEYDKVLSVNERNVGNASAADALAAIQLSGPVLNLTVQRCLDFESALAHAEEPEPEQEAEAEAEAEAGADPRRGAEAAREEARAERHLVTVILKKHPGGRSFGVDVGPADGELSAFAIRSIEPGSPADVGGEVKPGDLLVAINGQHIRGRDRSAIIDAFRSAGDSIQLALSRVRDSPHASAVADMEARPSATSQGVVALAPSLEAVEDDIIRTASYYTDAQNVDEELRRTGSLHVYGEGFAPAGVTGTDASGGHSLASTSSQQESVSVSSRSASGDHNVNGGQPGQEVDTTFQHALSRLSDDVKDNFDSQSNTSLSAAGPKRYNTLYPGPQHVPGKLDAHSVRSVGSVVATAHEKFQIELSRAPGEPLGMRVVGGFGDGLCVGYEGVVVDSIAGGGVVGRDKRLRAGDQLLQLNGASLVNLGLDEARELLRASEGAVSFVVGRQVRRPSSEHGSAAHLYGVHGAEGTEPPPQMGHYSFAPSAMQAAAPPPGTAVVRSDQTVRAAWHNSVMRSLFRADPERESRRNDLMQSIRQQRLQGGAAGLSLSVPQGLSRTLQRLRGDDETRSVASMRQSSRRPPSRNSIDRELQPEQAPAWDGEEPTKPDDSNSKWATLFLDRRFLFLRVEPLKGASMGLHVRCRPLPGTPLHLAGRKPSLQFMSVTSVVHGSPMCDAGVREDDALVMVNNMSLIGLDYEAAVDLIHQQNDHFLLAIARRTTPPFGAEQMLGVNLAAEERLMPRYAMEVQRVQGRNGLYVTAAIAHSRDFEDGSGNFCLQRGDKVVFFNSIFLDSDADVQVVRALLRQTATAQLVVVRTMTEQSRRDRFGLLLSPNRYDRLFRGYDRQQRLVQAYDPDDTTSFYTSAAGNSRQQSLRTTRAEGEVVEDSQLASNSDINHLTATSVQHPVTAASAWEDEGWLPAGALAGERFGDAAREHDSTPSTPKSARSTGAMVKQRSSPRRKGSLYLADVTPPVTPVRRSHSTETQTVVVHRKATGFGFTVTGPQEGDTDPGNSGIFISDVAGSSAASESNLRVGDRIVSANGVDLREASQGTAVDVVRSSKHSVTLTVLRVEKATPLTQQHANETAHSLHLSMAAEPDELEGSGSFSASGVLPVQGMAPEAAAAAPSDKDAELSGPDFTDVSDGSLLAEQEFAREEEAWEEELAAADMGRVVPEVTVESSAPSIRRSSAEVDGEDAAAWGQDQPTQPGSRQDAEVFEPAQQRERTPTPEVEVDGGYIEVDHRVERGDVEAAAGVPEGEPETPDNPVHYQYRVQADIAQAAAEAPPQPELPDSPPAGDAQDQVQVASRPSSSSSSRKASGTAKPAPRRQTTPPNGGGAVARPSRTASGGKVQSVSRTSSGGSVVRNMQALSLMTPEEMDDGQLSEVSYDPRDLVLVLPKEPRTAPAKRPPSTRTEAAIIGPEPKLDKPRVPISLRGTAAELYSQHTAGGRNKIGSVNNEQSVIKAADRWRKKVTAKAKPEPVKEDKLLEFKIKFHPLSSRVGLIMKAVKGKVIEEDGKAKSQLPPENIYVIRDFVPNQAAKRHGKLLQGDELLKVNGRSIGRLKLEAVQAVLKGAYKEAQKTRKPIAVQVLRRLVDGEPVGLTP